jgi:hypothetical protein
MLPTRARERVLHYFVLQHSKNLSLACICAFLALSLAGAGVSRGTIHQGIAEMDGWDFSDSSYSGVTWDLTFGITKTVDSVAFVPARQLIWVGSQYPGGVAVMPADSTYESQKEAPPTLDCILSADFSCLVERGYVKPSKATTRNSSLWTTFNILA